MKKQHAAQVRLISLLCFTFGCLLVLPFACPISLAEAAGPTTSITGNTVTGNFSTQVLPPPPGGKIYGIRGGQTAGTNLFHSFGQFNVGAGDTAQFQTSNLSPNATISNILGRINGQQSASQIFGTIDSFTFYPSANLFLMNPYGFLFGPTATVNVGGMVAFTSANYLRLEGTGGSGTFYADPTMGSILTSSPVAAFGFLGSDLGAITVKGSQLSVTPGQSISLVGGNITIQSGKLDDGTVQPAKLSAPGGQINLASVASPGEIVYPTLQSAPNINGQSFTAMGNVSLSEGALLDVSANAAGTVRIRGGQLVIADATISADTNNANGAPTAVDINITGDLTITDTRGVPALAARTTGAGDAGEVRVSSRNFSASTTLLDTESFHTLIDTHSAGTGTAGSVNISTGDLKITGNSASTILTFIDTGPQADGRGGDVTINAQTIEMTTALISTGTFIAVTQDIFPIGSAGNLTINANSFFGNFANFSTAGDSSVGSNQHAGDITLNVHNFHGTHNSGADLTGDFGGGVTITADTFIMDASTLQAFTFSGPGKPIIFNGHVLELNNGSTWTTSTFGDGTAGDIRVSANDHVSLIGQTGQNVFVSGNPTGIFSNSQGFFGNGAAGNIVITTPRLTMDQGKINTTTLSSGGGGNVTIKANVVEMSGEFPPGFAGDFFFFNVGNVQPSGIFTQTIGSDFCAGPCGNAGNINITTGSLLMGPGSQIDSGTTNSGQGGNISLNATNSISISGTLSDGSPVGVFSRSVGTTPDAGTGGNISLTAGQSVTLSNGASVSASTTGPGNAGNILMKANDISLSGGGTITASSTGGGNAGIVTIQGLNSPANSFLVDGAGSGVFTTTSSTGTGGNITIDANAVMLQNGAHLSSSSTSSGSTGNIQISAGNQFAMTNSSVTTEASQSGGGAIKVTANPNGTVQLTNSTISASVLDGNGGGGSVNIDPQSVVLINSQILANAVFGPGGNIFITTNLLLPDTASVISASSQFGQQGTITVQSPISPASGKIVPLGQKPLIETALVSQRCAAIADGKSSSFTVAGRDSLPAEPGDWLSSPLPLTLADLAGKPASEPSTRTSLSEPAEERPILSLRRIAPPGFLIQSFAADSSGCAS